MSQADPALWGFASMFAWGVGDMLGRYAALRLGSQYVALMVLGLGIAPPLLMWLSQGATYDAQTGGDFVALTALSGLLFSLAYVVFYRGLERGLVSIVSPLSASYLVVTTILTAIFFDEVVGPLKWFLISVILAGIVLTSTRGKSYGAINGLRYGITTMMLIGVAFTMWKPIVEDVGPFLAVVSVRLMATVFLGIYIKARRTVRLPFSKRAVVLVIGAGALDSLGFVAFNMGIDHNPVSVIIPIAAAYPVVTVALALVLLRERVSRIQMVGIVTVLVGVIAFSATS